MAKKAITKARTSGCTAAKPDGVVLEHGNSPLCGADNGGVATGPNVCLFSILFPFLLVLPLAFSIVGVPYIQS